MILIRRRPVKRKPITRFKIVHVSSIIQWKLFKNFPQMALRLSLEEEDLEMGENGIDSFQSTGWTINIKFIMSLNSKPKKTIIQAKKGLSCQRNIHWFTFQPDVKSIFATSISKSVDYPSQISDPVISPPPFDEDLVSVFRYCVFYLTSLKPFNIRNPMMIHSNLKSRKSQNGLPKQKLSKNIMYVFFKLTTNGNKLFLIVWYYIR